MSTMISVLGGVGLFLLGMSVMTGGLKALAGSRLRATLGKVAATPRNDIAHVNSASSIRSRWGRPWELL